MPSINAISFSLLCAIVFGIPLFAGLFPERNRNEHRR